MCEVNKRYTCSRVCLYDATSKTVIRFMFLGINMFWALLRAHFNPRLEARAKMTLSRAQNTFMPANINSIVLLIELTCSHIFYTLSFSH